MVFYSSTTCRNIGIPESAKCARIKDATFGKCFWKLASRGKCFWKLASREKDLKKEEHMVRTILFQNMIVVL